MNKEDKKEAIKSIDNLIATAQIMKQSNISINKEFQELIPKLSEEELKGLEESLLAEGCRDSIVLWNSTIIDGHNRFNICCKHKIEFSTIEKQFESKNDAKLWIIRNQFGRRNMNNYQRSMLALKLEEIIREKARANQGKRTDLIENKEENNFCLKSDKSEESKIEVVDTKKELAKIANVGHDTIMKVKKIKEKAPEEVKEKLEKGEVSINQVFNNIKKEEKKEQKKEESFKVEIPFKYKPIIKNKSFEDGIDEINNNSIDLLLTDPPYSSDIDNIEDFALWILKVLPKIKETGRAYICIGAYPKEINAYLNILNNQDKMTMSQILVWTYRNTIGYSSKINYNLNWQAILYLYGKEAKELKPANLIEQFAVQDINAPDGRLGNRFHTWQKPEELANRFIRHSTDENDIILDCFAGTGTFILEASKLGRKSLGFEKDGDMIEIAKKRGCIIE